MTETIELLEKLPPELQKEVLDFIQFLIEKKMKRNKSSDISKFAGILKKLPIDPLKFQKEIRSEWN